MNLNEKAIDRLYRLVMKKIQEDSTIIKDRASMKKGAAMLYETMMHELMDEDLKQPKEEDE